MAQNIPDRIVEFYNSLKTKLDDAKQLHNQVSFMLEQSQSELTKLTQRNTNITARLHQLQQKIDNVSGEEIRQAYQFAFDAQQRMLVMRGQIEKLQSDQANLQSHINDIEAMLTFIDENQFAESSTLGFVEGAGLLEKLIDTQEVERLKLSRLMHDGPAQTLSNFIVQTEIVSRLFEIDPQKSREELDSLKKSASATFQKVRLFIAGLRPMMLDEMGLIPTLKRYKDTYQQETGIETTLNIKGIEKRYKPYIETMIFRAAQELMTNTFRHNHDAPVKPNCNIQLNFEENLIRLSVIDNGRGFVQDEIADKTSGGLKQIRERLELIGGSMEIDTTPGNGAKVTLIIPVESTG